MKNLKPFMKPVCGTLLLFVYACFFIDCRIFRDPPEQPVPAQTTSDNIPELNEVLIRDHRYKPDTVRVRTNGTVKWSNNDTEMHSVSSDVDLFDSHKILVKAYFTFQFTTPGTYTYHCKYHDDMKGIVVVY